MMDYPALLGQQGRNPSPSSACLTPLNPMPSSTEEPYTHTPRALVSSSLARPEAPSHRPPRIESFVSAQSCSRSNSHTHRPLRSTMHILQVVPAHDQSRYSGVGPAPSGPIWMPEPARARAPFTLSVMRISNTSSSGQRFRGPLAVSWASSLRPGPPSPAAVSEWVRVQGAVGPSYHVSPARCSDGTAWIRDLG